MEQGVASAGAAIGCSCPLRLAWLDDEDAAGLDFDEWLTRKGIEMTQTIPLKDLPMETLSKLAASLEGRDLGDDGDLFRTVRDAERDRAQARIDEVKAYLEADCACYDPKPVGGDLHDAWCPMLDDLEDIAKRAIAAGVGDLSGYEIHMRPEERVRVFDPRGDQRTFGDVDTALDFVFSDAENPVPRVIADNADGLSVHDLLKLMTYVEVNDFGDGGELYGRLRDIHQTKILEAW